MFHVCFVGDDFFTTFNMQFLLHPFNGDSREHNVRLFIVPILGTLYLSPMLNVSVLSHVCDLPSNYAGVASTQLG